MNYKRILAVILALIMMFTLSACDNSSSKSTVSNSSAISSLDVTSDITSQTTTSVATKQSSSTATTSKKTTTTVEASSVNTSKQNTSSSTTNKSKVTPTLYKVTDKKGNIVWLFSSIHIGKKDFYPLPDYVMNAFESADALAVEFDLVAFEKDTAEQTKAMAKLISPNYSTRSHLVGDSAASIYRKAVEILDKNNMYNSSLNDYYKPVMWSTLIDNLTYQKAGAASEYGVDRHLLNRAKQKKKKIEEIESAESQYSMLAGFSDALQTKMLEDAIKGYESNTAKAELDTLMGLWGKGNASELGKLLNQDLSALMNETDTQKREILNEYYTAMYTDREYVMTDYIVNALNSGKEVFVCVGAAHIVRGSSIIDRLKIVHKCTVEEVKY